MNCHPRQNEKSGLHPSSKRAIASHRRETTKRLFYGTRVGSIRRFRPAEIRIFRPADDFGSANVLRAEDDLIHSVGPEPWWREAWYWGFYDRQSDLQFVCYLGVFPNRERADVIVSIYQHQRMLHHHMKMDYHISADIGEDRLSFGPVLMKPLEPMKHWRVCYVAPDVQVNVEFGAVHDSYSWAESKLWMEAEKEASSNHFDQIGRFQGEVRHAGATIRIDTLG